MNWLNLRTEILHSPEFIGCHPTRRATWLSLSLWCASQENGGIVHGGANWSDRQWQQTCGVTKDEATDSCDLFRVDGADVVLWGYNIEKEREVQAKRAAGLESSRKRWANGSPDSSANSSAIGSAYTERKEKENENEKGMRIGKEEGGAASLEALPALVLEMPEASKVGAILTFPCSGKAPTWDLTDATLAQLRTAYPQIDPLAECRIALAKIQTGAVTRKTASGMTRFLFNWMDRATNSTRNTSPTNGQHRQGFDHRNIATHSDREQLRTFSH